MINKKVLLVDDDEDDQLIFMDAIHEIDSGTECMIAHNGLEALEQLETKTSIPSIIFLDLNMPCMNGFEFMDRIKTNRVLLKIPVVIFTTSDNPMDERKAKESGAKIFFTKTADFNVLKTKLHEILLTDF